MLILFCCALKGDWSVMILSRYVLVFCVVVCCLYIFYSFFCLVFIRIALDFAQFPDSQNVTTATTLPGRMYVCVCEHICVFICMRVWVCSHLCIPEDSWALSSYIVIIFLINISPVGFAPYKNTLNIKSFTWKKMLRFIKRESTRLIAVPQ